MKPVLPRYQFGPFEFDPSQQALRNAGERVSLPAALNKLLVLLVSRPGQLVSREEIASALWDDQGTVDVETASTEPFDVCGRSFPPDRPRRE